MALHLNIKKARRSMRMTQKALAKRIGVVDTTVCLYESGERLPSLDVLIRLSATFNLPLDTLLADEIKQASVQDAISNEKGCD